MVEVVTFGCRLKANESEVISSNAEAAGLQDAVIFNTCAVTAEAERQARQAIRRMRRQRPGSRLIVTGCAAQISPDRYHGMAEVDDVVGNQEKTATETYRQLDGSPMVGDIMTASETAGHLIDGFEGRTRAFLQIQNGCDHRCTFCIIPFGRGRSRSVAVDEVLSQCRRLYDHGYREIVLTGVDVGDYGKDLAPLVTLAGLVRALLSEMPEDARLRITSIDPVEIGDDLVALYADDDRLMPHWHLSVQSGDDAVLRRMARRHRRDHVLDAAVRLREARPDTVLGADFIAGFPTETEDGFQSTLELVEQARLSLLHVFPYSEREGTAAARMPQLDRAVRKERAARLREAGERILYETMAAFVGATVGAVVESAGTARTDHYLPVAIDSAVTTGSHGSVRVERVAQSGLAGAWRG